MSIPSSQFNFQLAVTLHYVLLLSFMNFVRVGCFADDEMQPTSNVIQMNFLISTDP